MGPAPLAQNPWGGGAMAPGAENTKPFLSLFALLQGPPGAPRRIPLHGRPDGFPLPGKMQKVRPTENSPEVGIDTVQIQMTFKHFQ